MVVTMIWMESWTAVIISLCVLTMIGAILMCCICWETKKKSMHHFYILDDNGLTKVTSSEVSSNNMFEVESNQRARNMFRHLPSTDSFKNNFTTKILSTEKMKWSSERDLIQSMEIADTFEHSILRLEDSGSNNFISTANNQDKEEDVKSCISDDSKHTFYSTYMVRSTSAVGTIGSAFSQSDLHSCID